MARAMADQFTLYVSDRRGRDMSGPCSEEASLQDEIEDVEALLSETGAHYVFGLSAGIESEHVLAPAPHLRHPTGVPATGHSAQTGRDSYPREIERIE